MGAVKLTNIAKKFLGIAAILALLTASTPALAEALAASNLPVCCNTAMCPLHHRQSGNPQDPNDCGGKSQGAGSSMRACDSNPDQALEIAPFILVTPVTVFRELTKQHAAISMSLFFPVVVSLPSTPPPRTLPS
jgi:hypothetical protein